MDNGRNLTTVDGRGNTWSNSWDAMGRRLTLVTPNPGGGAFTHSMYYDGNGNITKTTDFKAVSHYYAYDMLNRMTGHGSNSSANDETYTFSCCSKLTVYTDAQGTSDPPVRPTQPPAQP
ncbi:hypothetical protein IT575_10945 [bacterium]|nr:hypothetical protein [bacterium]